MANTKELKERIKSVKETQKITNAMHLIATTKLRRANADVALTQDYFGALRREVVRMFTVSGDVDSRFFFNADGSLPYGGARGVMVVTADKGLAGAYNINVIREAEKILAGMPDARLFVVGEYGRRYFQHHDFQPDGDFVFPAQRPTYDVAEEMGTFLLDRYLYGELNEITIVSTRMVNSMTSEPVEKRLLPLSRKAFQGAEASNEIDYEYIPSLETVLDTAVRSYLNGFIYGVLVDSFCAEQNARVSAMDAANRSAQDLQDSLSQQLNRNRQAAITQEITEVSAGAQAQKKKKGRKEASAS